MLRKCDICNKNTPIQVTNPIFGIIVETHTPGIPKMQTNSLQNGHKRVTKHSSIGNF